jgi:tetraacyldisaccharide 4'-kinase
LKATRDRRAGLGGLAQAVWWRPHHPVAWLLRPLSWLFRALVVMRRQAYRYGWLRVERLSVPVIVVGNITVGGAGKTPLVIRLVELARTCGLRPGVIARGYGGDAGDWPQAVEPDSDPHRVGDEPVLIVRRTGCPVWVGPHRVEAGRALLAGSDCDLLLCDDGMQHYALARDLEIAVIDERGLGNRLCLPAGPLREPPSRLKRVDLVVGNGTTPEGGLRMDLVLDALVPLLDSRSGVSPAVFAGRRVHAVAGIGNPSRFFESLRAAGLYVIEHPFPDHHPFAPDEIRFDDGLPVLMTEKDAVKCRSFAGPEHWLARVSARLDSDLEQRLSELIRGLADG